MNIFKYYFFSSIYRQVENFYDKYHCQQRFYADARYGSVVNSYGNKRYFSQPITENIMAAILFVIYVIVIKKEGFTQSKNTAVP